MVAFTFLKKKHWNIQKLGTKSEKNYKTRKKKDKYEEKRKIEIFLKNILIYIYSLVK